MSEYSKLQSIADLDTIMATANEQPVVLFKHSLTCPISTAALSQYHRFLEDRPQGDSTHYTLVEIQNARDVSNEIAQRTGVRHESPQAILLRQGEVAWHASHWDIQSASLSAAVDD